MDQKDIRELINNSAISAVKMMTTNSSMKETFFFRISDIPSSLKIYDVMIILQKEYKLNFITNFHKCQSNNNMRNMIIACRNSVEYKSFIKHEAIKVKGYRMKVEESKRPININLVKIPEELQDDVKDLSRILSCDSADSYSKAFPTERILELLLEMEGDSWLLNGLEGVWLKYNHHQRKLEDKIVMMVNKTISFIAMSRFLKEYGNKNVTKRTSRIIMTYKIMWQRENVYEINDHEEAIYVLSKQLLEKDMISKELNFNNIRGILE